ncbi:hypothetical protein ABPG75_009312 [Micractinium tetrahymenae]
MQARFQSVSPPEPGSAALPSSLASQQQQQQQQQQLPGGMPSSSEADATTPQRGAAAAVAACRVRPAEAGDYWALADLHTCAFYPRATPFWFAALRLDRVMSLQVGNERQQDDARFLCLVAEADPSSSSSLSSSSTSSGTAGSGNERAAEAGSSASGGAGGVLAAATAQAAAAAVAAASSSAGSSGEAGTGPGPGLVVRDFLTPAGTRADRVDLGPLVAALVRLLFPPSMRQDYGASYSAGGLCGAVVIDTLGDYVPPRRTRMPNGTTREVPRQGVAYLSNLAVAPCSRRGGIGLRLVREAEQAAAEWGCRSVALHVDPSNSPAVEMYRRAGYRRVGDQPAWQRILEGRSRPLTLMMRVLPWEQRQRARRAWEAARSAEQEEEAARQRA